MVTLIMIRDARDAVRAAKGQACACSRFFLHKEHGCRCVKGKNVKSAKDHLECLIDSLPNKNKHEEVQLELNLGS